MNKGFYSKIAWSNIKKNYRFYIPHILTGAGLLGSFYIVLTLAMDERMADVRGGDYIISFMAIGTAVIALLSTILILYTNSFLMRQRIREFGLYNVLGMEKRHVGKVLLFETLFSGGIALLLGLAFGMVFYKICSLLICKFLGVAVIIGFYFITPKTIIPSVLFFVILYVLSYVFNRIRIARLKPVELLQENKTGEREPKVKWPIFVIGILTLGLGYYLAVSVESPLEALLFFFVAVFLVIIGTYCLFTAGSIFVLKRMKNNPDYYYDKNHMPAVSGLLYRMKQNAVGLASVCILATGVLVMISTTVSLYTGIGETLEENYPEHFFFSAGFSKDGNSDVYDAFPEDDLKSVLLNAAKENDLAIETLRSFEVLNVPYLHKDGELLCDVEGAQANLGMTTRDVMSVNFITQQEYEKLTGKRFNLANDEIVICPIATRIGHGIESDTLIIQGKEYKIVRVLDRFPVQDRNAQIAMSYGIVVPDETILDGICEEQEKAYGPNASERETRFAVTFADIDNACEKGADYSQSVSTGMEQLYESIREKDGNVGHYHWSSDSYWGARENALGMNGTLLFLGIILGFVCLFATTLIIYYKQISEGYEDRSRFQIMQKIGMSETEVRKTINGQVRIVFFLPLAVAGIHTAFAFPMLTKLLHILLMTSTKHFAICTAIVFGVFCAVYALIYWGTARTYYKIVH